MMARLRPVILVLLVVVASILIATTTSSLFSLRGGGGGVLLLNSSSKQLLISSIVLDKDEDRRDGISVSPSQPVQQQQRQEHQQQQQLNLISQCDIFQGKWVLRQSTYPLYRPGSCPFVEKSFSCIENGRPDTDYTIWSWKPFGCNLPRFNGTDFLVRLRNKRLVFVGDSLSRNQWVSMLCLLRESLADKSRIVEANNADQITKDKDAFIFHFLDYNCKVEFYRSHYLVAQHFKDATTFTIKLDTVHESHVMWKNASILVFTTGHWWKRGKTANGRSVYQEGQAVYPKLKLMLAFSKAMKTWAKWVDKFVNPKETLVVLSGYSPAHFRGGKWNSGGRCNNDTQPFIDESQLPEYPQEKMSVFEQTIRSMKVPVKLLNVSSLSSFRKDGHPSSYGFSSTQDHGYQDCSHWCLPGVPDIWNELLYTMCLLN